MSEKLPEITTQDPKEFFADLLGGITPTSALDVACSVGGFTGILKNSLKAFGQITGIDTSETAIAQAKENFPEEKIRFALMDAARMTYPDESFELVSCAFSLHHLPNPAAALAEIRRVLKPGGSVLFVEMYRDHLTKTQQTESMVHHWAAEIDTALGVLHNKTFTRSDILNLVQPESWENTKIFDLAETGFDPKGEEITQMLMSTIDRMLEKAKLLPNYTEHEQRAAMLRQRVTDVGTHISTRLIILAQK